MAAFARKNMYSVTDFCCLMSSAKDTSIVPASCKFEVWIRNGSSYSLEGYRSLKFRSVVIKLVRW